ncbi:MAG: riboflavin synthase [candidate division WOR-3 bacterium]|nr:riboflavin synthase [candidate division WOR-3 bacterium]MCX7947603.1 riboflavin synthase [candidate division WOR-3 bacterium]MDW8150488.1 riboflavin synthase [candidate division WOR-3 bacterium]
MFSGIVERTSSLKSYRKYSDGIFIEIENPYEELFEGESISLDGCCLTVDKFDKDSIYFFLSLETLKRTKFSRIDMKNHVFNLERSLTLNKLIGGHLVLGHVDDVGIVQEVKNFENTRILEIQFNPIFKKFTVYKGSICVDGVSLTINEIGESSFKIALIPKTIEITNLKYLKEGSFVNLEFDIIAKYVENLINKGWKSLLLPQHSQE